MNRLNQVIIILETQTFVFNLKLSQYKLLFFIALIFFIGITKVRSQPNLFRFQHISTDDGLSQNTVNAIVQDQFGFVWMGTNNGLNRYDGYSFKTFFYDEKDSTSLSINQIKTLFVDSKGRLWVGTEGGGLNVYNHTNQKFKRFQKLFSDSTSLSSNDINVIFEDLQGTIWVGTRDGFNKYIEATESFKRYRNFYKNLNGLASNIVTAIHSSSADHIWIGTYGGGIFKFNLEQETFTDYNKRIKHTLNDNNVWSVYEDKDRNVWIGSEKGALNVYNQKKEEWKYYGYDQDQLKNSGENLVRSIVPGINGDIWIGSDGGGVYQLNHGKNSFFKEYRKSLYLPESLGSNSVSTIYKDNSDVLWIGLVNEGVDRINLKQKPFYVLSHIPENTQTLCNSQINCVYQDSEGLYWIGTESGLNMGDKNLYKFNYFFEEYKNPKTINNNVPIAILEASNGEIWIGTYLGGVNIYNKKTKTFRYLVHDENNPNSLPSNFVRSIFEDAKGNFWIGTIRGALSKYNPVTKEFHNYSFSSQNADFSNSDFIMKVLGDKKGNIYAATYGGGLKIINTNTNELRTISQNSGLSNNQVISLAFDNDTILWIGTSNGLNELNLKTNRIVRFNIADGLPDNFINALVLDKSGDLWVSTNNGLSRLKKASGKFENFYKEDGLQSNEFNFNAAAIDKNGRIFFGGSKGLNFFYPNDIVAEEDTLSVVFTGVFINNKEIEVNEKFEQKVILSKPIFLTQKLNLNYKQNNFTLYFSALKFAYSDKIKYRYKIDDEDGEFINLGSRNFISFHDQHTGIHKLYIEASVSNFAKPGKITMLTIDIPPPWYKNPIFLVLLGVIIIFITLFIYYYRLYIIRQQKKELERIVLEKTNDLQEVNTMLEENQAELEMQHEELMSQSDLANNQNIQIQKQNQELMQHRINLEGLIRERTEELYIAKKKAERADDLKTSFLANMSHEIRTPMNAILGFLEILDDPIYTFEERTHFKGLINSSGHSLLALINDIIDIAKIESGQIDIYKVDFDLSIVFKELELIYAKKIKDEKANIKLYLNIPEKLILESDDLRIRQVLVNLLDNAFKFTQKGKIEFGYSIETDHVLCYVKDTGIGIPSEAHAIIFDRFRKLDSNDGKLYRGTGLGLAISKNIIELLDGEIFMESTPQKGSTFYFKLPVKK